MTIPGRQGKDDRKSFFENLLDTGADAEEKVQVCEAEEDEDAAFEEADRRRNSINPDEVDLLKAAAEGDPSYIQNLLDQVEECRKKHQLLKAHRYLEKVITLRNQGLHEDPELEVRYAKLIDQALRVKDVLSRCAPPRQKEGWKYFNVDGSEMWRNWDKDEVGKLSAYLIWEAGGTLVQHLASTRDGDAIEPLWDGAFWGMKAEHRGNVTLMKWLEKEKLTGNKVEIIVERIFCELLDMSPTPCWLVLERSPQVENFETFEGEWEGFQIDPPQHTRLVVKDNWRIIEPLSPTNVRCYAIISGIIPGALRWMISDMVIGIGFKMALKSSMKSWETIVKSLNEKPEIMAERQTQEAAFYDSVEESSKAYFQRIEDRKAARAERRARGEKSFEDDTPRAGASPMSDMSPSSVASGNSTGSKSSRLCAGLRWSKKKKGPPSEPATPRTADGDATPRP